ncbi:MAG: pilus assembly protein PilP [Zoogloeaceae bacterium]|jgi:type IV pilus assembly protein PilP|nr:pilus assembly protein PilP [Zoogloeaceae bacterium]
MSVLGRTPKRRGGISFYGLLALVFLMAAALSGCGDGYADLQTWMDDTRTNLGKPSIPKIPDVQSYIALAYQGGALTDPFSPSKIEPDKAKIASGKWSPDFQARQERNNIMETYPLEGMRMIGYLNINHQPLAAIAVNDMVRQVKVGEYIGLNFGKITKITDQGVDLEEVIEDSDGNWVPREQTLKLKTVEE